MPAAYNISFLIAGLAIILLVLFHFTIGSRHDEGTSTRIFLTLATLGAADIALEIAIDTMLLSPAVLSTALLYGVMTVFYLMQCAIPFIVFLYSIILCKELVKENTGLIALLCLPCAAFTLIILSNPTTHVLYSFDAATHAQVHGPFYFGMYAYALFYGIVAVLFVCAHRATLRKMDFLAMWEFLAIICSCAGLQYALNGLPLTGFGIGLGVLVLFLTISNPFELIDPLTGVHESMRFKRRVTALIRQDRPYGVVFVSLDYLRRINPIVSADFADDTIVLATHGLTEAAHDLPVYRLRKSLFAIIVHSRRERGRIVSELEAFFSSKHRLNGTSLELEASIGYVSKDAGMGSAEEMQAYIDYLIDHLQQHGSLPPAIDRHDLIEEFRRTEAVRRCVEDAIRNDLFEVYLQPLYSLKERRFVSAEALSRLNHPSLGNISPGEFIPIAEEEGLIGEIGRLQFEKICRFAGTYRDKLAEIGIRTIKVNVSPMELMDPDLADFFLDTMARYDVHPSFFQFEITETAATRHTEELNRFTEKMLEKGSALCMDDFGSGFANFNVVIGMSFEVIKLDASLLNGAVEDAHSGILYHGILSMMTDLGFSVVCEGVETREQAEQLISWDADLVQGFHFAQPMPLSQLFSWGARANA